MDNKEFDEMVERIATLKARIQELEAENKRLRELNSPIWDDTSSDPKGYEQK